MLNSVFTTICTVIIALAMVGILTMQVIEGLTLSLF
mgnify:CR=1 FL=1